MSEIIDFMEHMKKKDNTISSNKVATEEQVQTFSENVLKSMQEWISSKKPEKSDDNIISLASVIMTHQGAIHCIFDGVDNKTRLNLLGGLDILKSHIIKYIENNFSDI